MVSDLDEGAYMIEDRIQNSVGSVTPLSLTKQDRTNLLPRTSNDKVHRVDVRGLSLAADDVDVDVFRDLDVALGEGLEEG